MNYDLEIKSLISLLEGKICKSDFAFALDYFTHGENRLAFETLCDYLCEGDVFLSRLEYQKLLDFGGIFGADMESGRFKYLKKLSNSKPTRNI